jgi:uncharacterized protein (DUF4415 family)
MIARGEDQTDWARVEAMTEEELAAVIADDPDWQGFPPPEEWAKHATKGLPFPLPKEGKKQVTLRLDPDILEHFRRQGRGWQTRINAVLRTYVEAEARRPED